MPHVCHSCRDECSQVQSLAITLSRSSRGIEKVMVSARPSVDGLDTCDPSRVDLFGIIEL